MRLGKREVGDCLIEGCKERAVEAPGQFPPCRGWCKQHLTDRAIHILVREGRGIPCPVLRLEDYYRDPETGRVHKRGELR